MQSRRCAPGGIKARAQRAADEKRKRYKNEAVLSATYRYGSIIGREKEINELISHIESFRCCCSPSTIAAAGTKGCPHLPSDLLILGPSGTGKTVVTTRICEELVGKENYAVINLRTCYSPFSCMNSILVELGQKEKTPQEGLNSIKFEVEKQIMKKIDENRKEITVAAAGSSTSSIPGLPPFVLVLDDFDTPLRHAEHHKSASQEIFDALQGLVESLRQRGYPVCLFVITSEAVDNFGIDEKSRSRWCKVIVFQSYSKEDLYQILLDRCENAFPPSASPPHPVLLAVADYCYAQNGNARIAIELLGATVNAAFQRDALDASYATINDLENAKQHVIEESKISTILALSPQETFVLGAVAFLCKITGQELWSSDMITRTYNKFVKIVSNNTHQITSTTGQPVLCKLKKRRVEDYLKKMGQLGLIESERHSKGQGRGRESRKYNLILHHNTVGALALGTDFWDLIENVDQRLYEMRVAREAAEIDLADISDPTSCYKDASASERTDYEQMVRKNIQLMDAKIYELECLRSLEKDGSCGWKELSSHLRKIT